MILRLHRGLLGALILLSLCALRDRAAAATFTYSTDVGPQTAGWTNTAYLPQFDPLLGDLISVNLRFTGSLNGQVGVENEEDKFNVIYGVLAGFFNIYDSSNNLILNLSLSQTGSTVVAEFDYDLDYGGASGYTFGLGTSGQSSTGYGPLTDVSAFVGNGNLAYTVSAGDNSYGMSGTGNPFYFSLLNGMGTLEITYTTSVVPEPGALIKWGGLLGLCLALRNKQRRKQA